MSSPSPRRIVRLIDARDPDRRFVAVQVDRGYPSDRWDKAPFKWRYLALFGAF
jgi:hypothetical protein